MAARDIANLGAWPKRLFDDQRFLVFAPPAPPFRPDQYLTPHLPPVLKYVLKDVLYCPGTSLGRLQDGHTVRIYEGQETSLTIEADWERHNRLPNLHFIGVKDRDEVPAYLH